MLEGIDPGWISLGTRRYAGYTHIDPGKYVFRVRASNNDEIWNNEGAIVRVTVLPPYWKTWWFRLLAGIALVSVLALMYQYRVNKLLEVERTRNRIARDLHDEVSATLSGINYFAQAISGDAGNRVSPGSQKFLSLIHESATDVQESMSDIIWSINPENDDWNHVMAKLRRYASDLFDSKGIRYKIDTPQLTPTKSLTMEHRRHFWLIYKEMVTNIVKHSACSEASVAITLDQGKSLRLVVADNGKGFDPEGPSDRNGNKNIRSRAKALGATVHLDTTPGKGTRWELVFPL
jgi:signal transduction histidine kinase